MQNKPSHGIVFNYWCYIPKKNKRLLYGFILAFVCVLFVTLMRVET